MVHEHAVKWEPVLGINAPCADLFFSYECPDTVLVTMRFSNVNGGIARDLQLKFKGAISLRWETESIGLNPLPLELPRCSSEMWSKWAHPLIQIVDSSWLADNESMDPVSCERRAHFALICMNDLLQVIALAEVETGWIDPNHA